MALTRGLLPGSYPTSKHFTTSGAWDLLPGNHKALGVTVFTRMWVDLSATPGVAAPVTHLADMWRDWEWSNPGNGPGGAGNWIKPQLDAAKAAGCNYVRFIGTLFGRDPASGYATISDTNYFNRWQQVLDYCRSIGLYVYPTFEFDTDAVAKKVWYGYSPFNSWRVPEYQHLMRLFQAYLDIIIGIDIQNEGYSWASQTSDTSFNNPGGNKNNGDLIYNAIKPIEPSIPLTISTFFKNPPNQADPKVNNVDGQRLPQIQADFWDTHIYYDATVSDFDVVTALGVPVLIGEFGQDFGSGSGPRQSRYNAVKAVVNRNFSGRLFAGAAAWSMWDSDAQTTLNQFRYGLASNTGTTRNDVSALFSSFPS